MPEKEITLAKFKGHAILTEMERRNWTREELILALNLYLKLPFGKLHSRTPEIVHLAELIGRTSSSVAMRLNNFASVDPYHQNRGIVGLPGGKKQVQPIWDEFINNRDELLFLSEEILAGKEHKTVEVKFAEELIGIEGLRGEDKVRAVKTRVNQSVFRKIVLANYSYTCAVTGIAIPELLVASHIVPWSKNAEERLNPENGICLSPLFDRAFDLGYIGFTTSYEILVSTKLSRYEGKGFYTSNFGLLSGAKINLPTKYFPKREFLQFHLDVIFKG